MSGSLDIQRAIDRLAGMLRASSAKVGGGGTLIFIPQNTTHPIQLFVDGQPLDQRSPADSIEGELMVHQVVRFAHEVRMEDAAIRVHAQATPSCNMCEGLGTRQGDRGNWEVCGGCGGGMS